jgi:hypothetical protein
MSLKALHILFVTISTLLAVGFGLWCMAEFREGHGAGYAVAAAVSFLSAPALVVYGVYFLRKLQRVSFF